MQLIIQTLSGFKDMQRHRLVVQVAIVSLLTSVLALVGPAANPVSSQEIPLNLFRVWVLPALAVPHHQIYRVGKAEALVEILKLSGIVELQNGAAKTRY